MNVYILLDRSGSMEATWKEAVKAIGSYVKKLDVDDMIHLAVFDNEYNVIRDCPVSAWADITDADAYPRGMTALYDSCGKIMKTAEEDGVEKTVLVIMTDGHENASREYAQHTIKAKIEKWENEYNWQVVFLGANFDQVSSVSASLGALNSKTANFSAGNYMRGFDTLAVSSMAYKATGQAMAFTEDDKKTLSNSL
jgi:uncharacterized protein with von Willebrand factor type A (vWA) domain